MLAAPPVFSKTTAIMDPKIIIIIITTDES